MTSEAIRGTVHEDSSTEIALKRFNVHEYHQMAEAGILDEDDRVELIDGAIVIMSPIGPRHAECVIMLTELLSIHFSGKARVSVQNPLRIPPHDEPQPDVTVLRRRDYSRGLPDPGDVLLVLEVSDTTVHADRRLKLPLYARAGILECWLIDLQGQAIERHTDPSKGSYREVRRVGRGDEIESLSAPGLVLKADDVLGEAAG